MQPLVGPCLPIMKNRSFLSAKKEKQNTITNSKRGRHFPVYQKIDSPQQHKNTDHWVIQYFLRSYEGLRFNSSFSRFLPQSLSLPLLGSPSSLFLSNDVLPCIVSSTGKEKNNI